jgi:hypothetical protein
MSVNAGSFMKDNIYRSIFHLIIAKNKQAVAKNKWRLTLAFEQCMFDVSILLFTISNWMLCQTLNSPA